MTNPTIDLSPYDRAALDGEHGPAEQMAMRILVRMAPAYGAERMLDISAAHIDSSVYMGPATLEFAERLVHLGARVKVPATLNVSGVDEHGWREWQVPEEWAEGARRQMDAYRAMGCIQTWTCAPYQTEHRPTFGQQIASGESNAIAFFNSVIGARTERYPDLLDICAAITGRAPACGLHLTENRRATHRLVLRGVGTALQEEDSFWPVFGHFIGNAAPDGVPVVEGIGVAPSEDQLKAVGAAAASSGATALFHIVGVTPEAPTLAAVDGDRLEAREVTLDDLRRSRRALSDGHGDTLNLVLLGSPHFSITEFQRFCALVEGRSRHPDVRVIITCSRAIRDIVQRTKMSETLDAFGARLTVDTCPLVTPMLPSDVRHIMTNSAKYAYYAPGLLGTSVRYGGLHDCVRSAEAGRVIIDETIWA